MVYFKGNSAHPNIDKAYKILWTFGYIKFNLIWGGDDVLPEYLTNSFLIIALTMTSGNKTAQSYLEGRGKGLIFALMYGKMHMPNIFSVTRLGVCWKYR